MEDDFKEMGAKGIFLKGIKLIFPQISLNIEPIKNFIIN